MRALLAAASLATLCTIGTGLRAQDGVASERAMAREIFQQLIEIPTTQADKATPKAAQTMADRLLAAGFPRDDVQVFTPEPGVGTLVARLRGTDRNTRPILMLAHIDVVPALRADWSVDPWTFTERDGWFYGRGTTDNKAGAAMLVADLITLKRAGWQPARDLIVVLTGDEETAQRGIQSLVTKHRDLIDADLAFNKIGRASCR